MDKLHWYVQAMAQPYETQVTLFPSFVEVADDLAMGWEESLAHHLKLGPPPSAGQAAAMQELDAFLEAISGQENARYWTMEALKQSPEWVTIRSLAHQLILAMGWDVTVPRAEDGDIYVGPPEARSKNKGGVRSGNVPFMEL